jgi:LysR family hydrogen peroxide-inducible transcriptional activator
MSRPTLQQLAYFVAVADERSFSRAADVCSVSQPALSAQLRELESRLGVQLVERLPRDVRVTPAGAALLPRARMVLTSVDELIEIASTDDAMLRGPLVVGVIPTIAPYLLGSFVPLILQRLPGIELFIEELQTELLIAALRSGEVDLALCASPLGSETLSVAHVGDDPLLVAFSQNHALASGTGEISLKEFAKLEVLLLNDGHCLRDQTLSLCKEIHATTTDLRATSLPTLVQMVAAGIGVTLLPAMAASVEARPGNGVMVRPLAGKPSRRIELAWRSSTPRARHYKEIAAMASSLLTL